MMTFPLTLKSVRELNQPYVRDCRMPSTTKNNPAADKAAPTRSNCGRCAGRGGSGILRASSRIAITTATCRTNEDRHPIQLVNMPPISGPAAAPNPPAPLTTPKYRARVSTSSNHTVTRM
jgi:hypothetical protein